MYGGDLYTDIQTYAVLIVDVFHLVHSQTFLLVQLLLLYNKKNSVTRVLSAGSLISYNQYTSISSR